MDEMEQVDKTDGHKSGDSSKSSSVKCQLRPKFTETSSIQNGTGGQNHEDKMEQVDKKEQV